MLVHDRLSCQMGIFCSLSDKLCSTGLAMAAQTCRMLINIQAPFPFCVVQNGNRKFDIN